MLGLISYRYLVDPDEVREELIAFANQPVIGLDTETFWDQDSRINRLSLLQLASPTGEIVVIDALSAGIDASRPLIEDPQAMMAAHNAKFDEGVLRQNGFDVAGLVDTLKLSRRTLQLHSHSLASVAAHLFELTLDKRFQLSDWRRRPLSREQLYYAAMDAVVALRVFQELADRLAQQGRWPAELKRAQLKPPGAEPEKKPRKSSLTLRPLTSDERQIVEKLQLWRQQQADIERLPLYLICHDKTLDHLAIVKPRTIDELAAIYGLGPAKIAKYGEMVLGLLVG